MKLITRFAVVAAEKFFLCSKLLCAFFGESLITFSKHFISIGGVTRIELCILIKICNRPMIIA